MRLMALPIVGVFHKHVMDDNSYDKLMKFDSMDMNELVAICKLILAAVWVDTD